MSSKRTQVLNYIRDNVFDLITTGNGYNFTVPTKERGVLEVDNLPESSFPCLFIAKAPERRTDITVNNFNSNMDITILGYVKNSSGLSGLQDDMDKLIEDVTKALESDRTFGGLAKTFNIGGILTDDGDLAPFGVVAISLTVSYVSEKGTP